MNPGTFQSNLKKLNKNLTIMCGSDDSKPAGLYLKFYDEPIHICGVDRNDIPERTIADAKGHIVKSGWRRTLNILITKRLIDKYEAQRVFRTELTRGIKHIEIEQDPTYRAMAEITRRRMEQKDGAVVDKEGKLVPVYRREDFMDWRDVMQQARRK